MIGSTIPKLTNTIEKNTNHCLVKNFIEKKKVQ